MYACMHSNLYTDQIASRILLPGNDVLELCQVTPRSVEV